MNEWQDIKTAPKDGSSIRVTALDKEGQPFEVHKMQWGHIQKNAVFAPDTIGMWVAPNGSYTWREGEGGPTHWRPE